MKSFKFFQNTISKTPIEGTTSLYGLTIHNHPDAMFADGEITVVYYWGNDDNIRDEYELVMYHGSVSGFINAYQIRRNNPGMPNRWLPEVPRLHSIEYENGDVYDRWNHEFQDPNQQMIIHYKLYTR